MEFAGTDNRFYSSHVFSPHRAPHRKLSMLRGLHIQILLLFSGIEEM